MYIYFKYIYMYLYIYRYMYLYIYIDRIYICLVTCIQRYPMFKSFRRLRKWSQRFPERKCTSWLLGTSETCPRASTQMPIATFPRSLLRYARLCHKWFLVTSPGFSQFWCKMFFSWILIFWNAQLPSKQRCFEGKKTIGAGLAYHIIHQQLPWRRITWLPLNFHTCTSTNKNISTGPKITPPWG